MTDGLCIRGQSGKMAFFSFFILALCIVGRDALTKNDCGPHFRRPEYSDINVTCGTSAIHLAIQICPAIYTGYNASLLILNHVQGDLDCKGTLDASVSPPVVRFSFPIREGNACGSKFVTTSAPGTGIFSNFSIIQTVNVSGVVRSLDVTVGMVSYNTELKYLYSCAYPLEYFINNTQLDVSSSSIALKDNNGSFISTLSITLYKDINYTTPLIIPRLGLELRTIIFVQVAASNLTSQYFVHLDRCYASTSPQPSNSTFFNLFVSCSVDPMTTMLENGESQKARFYFPVFRFIEQENETVSTYYLHCITRLCERTMCSTFKQCNRRKRHAETSVVQQKPSETSVLTVPIKAMTENSMQSKEEAPPAGDSVGNDASVDLGIPVAVLSVLCATAIFTSVFLFRKLKRLS